MDWVEQSIYVYTKAQLDVVGLDMHKGKGERLWKL